MRACVYVREREKERKRERERGREKERKREWGEESKEVNICGNDNDKRARESTRYSPSLIVT